MLFSTSLLSPRALKPVCNAPSSAPALDCPSCCVCLRPGRLVEAGSRGVWSPVAGFCHGASRFRGLLLLEQVPRPCPLLPEQLLFVLRRWMGVWMVSRFSLLGATLSRVSAYMSLCGYVFPSLGQIPQRAQCVYLLRGCFLQ